MMESGEKKHIQAHFLLMFSFFSALWFIYCIFNQPSWFYEKLKDSANILLSHCQAPEWYLAVFRIPPAVGLVDVKLWGWVLSSATSLIPAPCFCLCCASPQEWHRCANLSTPQTPESGASPRPLTEGPWAEAVSPSLDSSISHAGRAAKGTCRKTVHLPLCLSRGGYAHLLVPSLGHYMSEFGDKDLVSLQDPS